MMKKWKKELNLRVKNCQIVCWSLITFIEWQQLKIISIFLFFLSSLNSATELITESWVLTRFAITGWNERETFCKMGTLRHCNELFIELKVKWIKQQGKKEK
jgi:hypothetical protein